MLSAGNLAALLLAAAFFSDCLKMSSAEDVSSTLTDGAAERV